MNLLSFFRPGKDGRAIPADPTWGRVVSWHMHPAPEYYGLIKWGDSQRETNSKIAAKVKAIPMGRNKMVNFDPITTAASTMGKRGAVVRHDRERAKVRAKCNEMCVAMGREPAFKDVT